MNQDHWIKEAKFFLLIIGSSVAEPEPHVAENFGCGRSRINVPVPAPGQTREF